MFISVSVTPCQGNCRSFFVRCFPTPRSKGLSSSDERERGGQEDSKRIPRVNRKGGRRMSGEEHSCVRSKNMRRTISSCRELVSLWIFAPIKHDKWNAIRFYEVCVSRRQGIVWSENRAKCYLASGFFDGATIESDPSPNDEAISKRWIKYYYYSWILSSEQSKIEGDIVGVFIG